MLTRLASLAGFTLAFLFVVAVTVRADTPSKQALSVIGGLEADVVTMNQASDVDVLVE